MVVGVTTTENGAAAAAERWWPSPFGPHDHAVYALETGAAYELVATGRHDGNGSR